MKDINYVIEHTKLNVDKKYKNGEVFTPIELINKMLDTLPEDVWSNPDLKWLDTSAGIANFPFIIYERLMVGLKIKNKMKRTKHILTNMIYMVELDATNCNHIREIFGNNKINLYEGSYFDYCPDITFDIILGNPPYQFKAHNKKSKPIWHLFVKYSYEKLLNEKGFLLFIHPSGWRDISGIYRKIYDYIKEHKLIYLNMNTYKTGQKVFKVNTNFDYYLIQHVKETDNMTTVNDIDNNEYKINLNEWDFIPNGKFEVFEKLLAKKDNEINVLYDSSTYDTRNDCFKKKIDVLYDRTMYGIDKNNMDKLKTDNYKYPCVYTISQKNGLKCFYSYINKGHFGIPKVIWTNGSGTYPIIDKIGEYGLTQFAYAIIDDKDNLEKIKDAMLNIDFLNLMKYTIFKKDNNYNFKIIALFRKDFYNMF